MLGSRKLQGIIIWIIFKVQENQRFSASQKNTLCKESAFCNVLSNSKRLFQVNFEFGRFLYFVKYNRAVVLSNIREV